MRISLASRKIVFDHFHLMHDDGELVRGRENRLLIAQDDNRLKGTKHLWIFSKENVRLKRRTDFCCLRGSDRKTARAWTINENMRHPWSFRVEGWARRYISQSSGWEMRSSLDRVEAVDRMIDRRLANIITCCRRQLTTAFAEGLNSKIMAIKR